MLLRTLAVTVLLAAVASPAHALTWSRSFTLPGRDVDVDFGDAPSAALNARGDLAASWVGAHGYAVAVGDLRHGFAKPLASPVDDPRVAMGATGRALVLGADFDDIQRGRYVVLSRSGARLATHRLDSSDAAVAALPDGAFLLAYRTGATLRAVRVNAEGRPGRAVTVSRSARSEDELELLSTPQGEVVACCGSPATAWRRSPQGTWSKAAFTPARHEYPETVAAAPGLTLFAGLQAVKGDFGSPVLELLRAGASRRVVVGVPSPATTAVQAATIDGAGRPLVTYADNGTLFGVTLGAGDAPAAAAALGAVTPEDYAGPPVAAPLGDGALVGWTLNRRWRAATEREGVFTPVPAPAGDVEVARIVSAGGAAALAWYDGSHRAHVAVAAP